MNMKSTFAGLFFAAGLMIANGASAEEIYIDNTGYAVSGYDVVAYFDMKQVPIGEDQQDAVPGMEYIFAKHNGATYLFSSMEHRGRFMADPAKYVPQFGGHCAHGVLFNAKVPGNPNNWRIVGGKLYFANQNNGLWEKEMVKNIINADDLWSNTDNQTPSSDAAQNGDQGRTPSRS